MTRRVLLLVLAATLGWSGWRIAMDTHVERRVAGFSPEQLTPRGQRAFDRLVDAEIVEDTYRSWTWDNPETTYSLLDLWDEEPELGTRAFLAICEQGTPAARFYALAALSQSDPWTFSRAWRKYSSDGRELKMTLGCFGYDGSVSELTREMVIEGALAEGWRGIWTRTERSGEGLDRELKAEYVAQRERERAAAEQPTEEPR